MAVQMRDIPKGKHTEGSNPIAALFRSHSGYRGGGSTAAVPQHHGRYIQQMAEQHAFHAEVAEEQQDVIAGPKRTVIVSISFITILF